MTSNDRLATEWRKCGAPGCSNQVRKRAEWGRGRGQTYCSPECRPSTYRRIYTVGDVANCEHCSTPFARTQAAGRPSKYCSTRCRKQAAYPTKRSKYVAAMQTERTATCRMCTEEYVFTGRKRKYCSDECELNFRRLSKGQRANGTPVDCQHCGKAFPATRSRYVYCSPECSKAAYLAGKAERDSDKNHTRRIRCVETATERIDRLAVFIRDRWICGLCDERIDCTLRWPNPDSVSLDHIVPLSQGGTHTYDNVQAAHLGCNVRANAKRRLIDGEEGACA